MADRTINGAVDVAGGLRLRLVGPEETVEFSLDWASAVADGVTIEASAWSISPEGPVVSAELHVGMATSCLVAGVEVGAIHRLTNEITTDTGLTAETSFTLRGAPL